jgi:hypothetical protein
MKDKIAFWYKHKIWTKEMVRNAVEKGIITEDDYNKIAVE